MENQIVHRAAANPDDRCAASLTLQCDQPKCFLHARMNKEIGRAIIPGELARVGAVFDPGKVFRLLLQFTQLISFGAVADYEKMKIIWPSPLQNFECTKQSRRILLFRQTADVEQKLSARINAERLPNCFLAFDQAPEDCRRLVELFAERRAERSVPLLVLGLRTSGSYLAPATISRSLASPGTVA